MQDYLWNMFSLFSPFSNFFCYLLSNQCHTPKLYGMHWNCTGTLGIGESAPFDTGLPPNKEPKIRSRRGGGGNEFCIPSNRAVL